MMTTYTEIMNRILRMKMEVKIKVNLRTVKKPLKFRKKLP